MLLLGNTFFIIFNFYQFKTVEQKKLIFFNLYESIFLRAVLITDAIWILALWTPGVKLACTIPMKTFLKEKLGLESFNSIIYYYKVHLYI